MTIHIRWQGRSYEWTHEDLDLREPFDEEELLTAVAQRLETDVKLLRNELVIDWGEEAVVLRPKAIFG